MNHNEQVVNDLARTIYRSGNIKGLPSSWSEDQVAKYYLGKYRESLTLGKINRSGLIQLENNIAPSWAKDLTLKMNRVIKLDKAVRRVRIKNSKKKRKASSSSSVIHSLFNPFLFGKGTVKLDSYYSKRQTQKNYMQEHIKELHEAMTKPIIKSENIESASDTVNRMLGIHKPKKSNPINKTNLQRYYQYCLDHGMVPSKQQLIDEIRNILSTMNSKQVRDVLNYFKRNYDFDLHDRVKNKPYIGTSTSKTTQGEILHQLLSTLELDELRQIINEYEHKGVE